METKNNSYRKNFMLIISFTVLITVSLVVAQILGYNLTKKFIENEFTSLKIDVLDQTVEPYNRLFQNKIPELSFYQGFLDSLSAAKYADTVFKKYPFVEHILFYDSDISNHPIKDGLKVNRFSIGLKTLFKFGRNVPQDSIVIFRETDPELLSLSTSDEFNKVGLKFASFIETADTTKALTNDQIFKIFYSIVPSKISYMNIPRREDIKIYKDLMFKTQPSSPLYDLDIFSFELNPYKLEIKNIHPALYQNISIKPLSYDSMLEKPNIISTEITLPGAFTDYKIHFSSEQSFLNREVNHRFLPIAVGIFIIYLILALIALLIYRNLNVNQKLYSLQYDFINNFTHEFKTPVSVIKIAGSNILNAKELSEKERLRYGRILDEEADKLNDLMNKLLSFTQIENKAITIKPQEINLEIFAQNMIDAFQLKYADYHIDLEIEDVERFNTDPVLLSSIFHNLMENAYKYASPGSKNLGIKISRNKKDIIFSFKDTGIGIDANELNHIFKKFYRIQNRYNQQGSVGLGLAFCKELVNFMDGIITVKSKPNIGSEFEVILPYDN
ncbi:MAG: HAMP domain-containing histidine kinase [Bacteroidetes bacterium]|nr:HAMP domain-containing histidine kinase [Bacteroidota bacterium]MBU1372403.1 HAMP domain-containing histidine kinase [Bacteroidota bacterium]MBU1483427.1 HAMP domain-containing histidine kinase [Bacteroidota bacterium]MBU1761135.1 HAMP domain-containing histidine kinase [Bacteroidota bacterium]MBU2046163.1 HAMP domain-containing histidine kinase [Bacteroidota bacterium]